MSNYKFSTYMVPCMSFIDETVMAKPLNRFARVYCQFNSQHKKSPINIVYIFLS